MFSEHKRSLHGGYALHFSIDDIGHFDWKLVDEGDEVITRGIAPSREHMMGQVNYQLGKLRSGTFVPPRLTKTEQVYLDRADRYRAIIEEARDVLRRPIGVTDFAQVEAIVGVAKILSQADEAGER